MLVCSALTSRGSLFVVILLLLSDPDELGCSALFSSALSSLITTNVILAACSSRVLSSPVTSPVLVFGSLLAVSLVRAPEPDDHPLETGVWWQVLLCVQRNFLLGMTDNASTFQYAFRSWILGRVSFNCTSQRAIVASRADPHESPPNKASILLRHASLWVCYRPWPVLRYPHPGQPSLRPHCSKSALRRKVLATLFSIKTLPGGRSTISAGLSIPT